MRLLFNRLYITIINYDYYRSCGNCPFNQTECLAKHCVSADGRKRGLFTANRQMPGPSIQVKN